YVSEMKGVNPDLVLLVYKNAMFTNPNETYTEDQYSHDASGNRITSVQFGTYLMNPSSTDWANHIAMACKSLKASSKFDGCYLDVLGATAPLNGKYTDAPPINPATGQVWTAEDWMTATSALAGVVQSSNPGVPIVANGLSSGQQYFDRVSP